MPINGIKIVGDRARLTVKDLGDGDCFIIVHPTIVPSCFYKKFIMSMDGYPRPLYIKTDFDGNVYTVQIDEHLLVEKVQIVQESFSITIKRL